MIKRFSDNAWADYLYWQTEDRKTLKRINKLIESAERTPFEGIGKPEPLKHEKNLWSRRINEFDRLIYYIENKELNIVACRTHYRKK